MALLGRDTKVTGAVDEGVLLLETFQGKETLGLPYRYDLTLLSDDANLPVDKVLGAVRFRLIVHAHHVLPRRDNPGLDRRRPAGVHYQP